MLKGPAPAGIPSGCNGRRSLVFWNGKIFPLKELVSCPHWCLMRQLSRHWGLIQYLIWFHLQPVSSVGN